MWTGGLVDPTRGVQLLPSIPIISIMLKDSLPPNVHENDMDDVWFHLAAAILDYFFFFFAETIHDLEWKITVPAIQGHTKGNMYLGNGILQGA